jgi:hypothetical protein
VCVGPRVVRTDDVVGDREHVEPGAAIEVDELRNRERAVVQVV